MDIVNQKIFLPKTVQTTSYRTGDDGYFQTGNPRKTRFIDNLNGTITDLATGLTWIKQPELIIQDSSTSGYSRSGIPIWQAQRAGNGTVTDWASGQSFLAGDVIRDADGSQSTACNISAATAANPCVLTVDNIQGLVTGDLVFISNISGDIGTDILNENRYYTKVDSSAKTLALYSNTILSSGVNTTGKTYISGGTAIQNKFYNCILDHTSDTFSTDIAANKWIISRWTASSADLTTPRVVSWGTAIDYCLGSKWNAVNTGGAVGLSYAGYTDWRLPNAFEIASLVNFAAYPAAINATFFPNTPSDSTTLGRYWTSTVWRGNTAYSITRKFRVDSGPFEEILIKTGVGFIRPVRGGRLNTNG